MNVTEKIHLPNGFSSEQLANALDPDALELILLPTEKCNFRCTYCYEDFVLGRMSPDVISGIKALLKKRSSNLRRLRFSWFGGEPLLAKNIVLDLSGYAKTLSDEYKIDFVGGATTNGYFLDEELLSSLVSLNQKFFQISLDGDSEWHDRTRKQANGRGSFDRIVENLLSAKNSKLDFLITLRIHVHVKNRDSVVKLTRFLRKEFSDDPRFRLFFHKIDNLGGGGTDLVLNNDDYRRFLESIESDNTNKVDKREGAEIQLQNYICYAAKPNSILIRPDGRVGKCTVLLSDSRNDIGKICKDGTLKLNTPALQAWFEGFRTFDRSILGCPATSLPSTEDRSGRSIESILVE